MGDSVSFGDQRIGAFGPAPLLRLVAKAITLVFRSDDSASGGTKVNSRPTTLEDTTDHRADDSAEGT